MLSLPSPHVIGHDTAGDGGGWSRFFITLGGLGTVALTALGCRGLSGEGEDSELSIRRNSQWIAASPEKGSVDRTELLPALWARLVAAESLLHDVLPSRSMNGAVGEGMRTPQAIERRRCQLIEYLMLPQVAEFSMAKSLTMSRAEALRVEKVQGEWIAVERRRTLWFEHFLAESLLAKASELVVTPLEKAKLARAMALRWGRFEGCLPSSSPDVSERRRHFREALDSGAWTVAAELAVTEVEVQAVDRCRQQAALMVTAAVYGHFDQAHALCQNEEERGVVDAFRARVVASSECSAAKVVAAIRLQARVRGSFARRFRCWSIPRSMTAHPAPLGHAVPLSVLS